ncbi:A-kinase anchor protein 6 [Siniperca chuatsi]|uniref:A-kinase anchor protein 6 n=1 Tax=Siniperca chuatsi TaxID=119488 RepID=UPI001CE1647E|nr:A-kinase anchor protein 6 [Siniperca chuatsi]XP_044023570.1 A-kinase anchor protein 6 [Siniperca chuatsi]XP_044023571.1 A-kinase anchor protein 6 [Siniperca chuatsi]XP_044023572.1 A-kinase anchor protein 6 [Siniperca chuatsi]XP_044023573.1 A-kinase anchor protein 6 [Siniperca chuatsi]XP_044023574.1 A-kinase anchor protein 6 [Siniperca chuatsi]XP_044023575.1 A-kinase anchor protein 6 [Siniperca chuatsi]
MSIVALSPVAPEPPSPMVTSITPVTPTLDPDTSTSPTAVSTDPLSLDVEHQSQDGASSPSSGPSRGSLTGGGPHLGRDPSQRSKKPPPLHTGADWKVVLHLPEIETWLRVTSDRVTQLTHSVGQDSDNRHVDVHLVQLKDICEDISDHVEQIHALLETEFSLKLLSYSVNIIVDIRTVQLLWHQLRVSVLVLKERLLQGLQDSNGNYTRQTDILQAFSEDQHQTRLDALTEVDDCGQLTIRCSQDYFSLDCGITAFELSDYSPSDEPEARGTEPGGEDPFQELSQAQGPNPEPGAEESEASRLSNHKLHNSLPELTTPGDSTNHNHSPSILPTMQCGTPNHSESTKRPLQGVSHSTEVSPTQPSLPKRAALFSDGGTRQEDSRGGLGKVSLLSGLQFQAELSQSTPSLMDAPDRSKFWLELDTVYPENVSQSYESLQVMNGRNLQKTHVSSRQGGCSQGSAQRPLTDPRSPFGARPTANTPLPLQDPVSQDEISKQMERTQKETHAHSEGDSDSSLPSPMREQFLFSDLEASGEESDLRPPPGKTAVWIVKSQAQKGAQVLSKASPDREHWYGSEEFLALPAQLRKTEMLTMKLESLAQSIPARPGGCDSTQEALQDVDDWDLTELNPDWDVGESGDNVSSIGESEDDIPSSLPPLLPYRRNLVSRLSTTSSSDIAPSLDESIESGPLSDLQSEEDEGRRSADRRLQLTAPSVDVRGGAILVHQLLEDIQSQDKDPNVWKKIECFVQQLDGFISWLQEALDSTENWTQPRQELESLRVYLDTHLSFKLNVDSHSALKESVMEEGRALLSIITSHQSGLKDILHMVSSQWDQLQRQIRRQHGWMLRALRCIQAHLLYTSQSHEPFTASGDASANRQAPCPAHGLKAELISSQCEAQRAALEQMAIKLTSLQYPSPASRRHYSQLARNNSLQEFEAEYQELWDWLTDMDAMVTDGHQLMMSEEQRHHLFKSSHAELMMMESRKTSLLGRAESLKRSGTELPGNFHRKIHNLTHTWRQLEKILSEHSGPSSSQQNQSANMNSLLVGGQGVAMENPRSALSPLTNSLLEQLEARIKELKAWLRDTELLIFNSCLRQDKDASEQLQSFKSLCSEVLARRRGVSSVLKLCQKLLQQSQSGPMAEVGPEAEQHREALQLLSINLERRWEAIVMQALQWQNRLKRELGEQQVPGNFLEPGLVDLHQISPVPAGPVAPPPDDSWEWDETDMTITEPEPQKVPEPDLTHNLPIEPNLPSDIVLSSENQPDRIRTDVPASQCPEMMSSMRSGSSSEVQPSVISQTLPPNNNNIYQVYSLHNVELYRQPQFPHTSSLLRKTKSGKRKQHLLLKSLSKDSSFSSIESLPDLLGGLMSNSRGGDRVIGYRDGESEREGGRGSGQSVSSRRSESESGIVSDTGDIETTTTNSEIQGEEEDPGEDDEEEKEQRKDETVDGSNLALHKDNVTRYNQKTKTEENMKEKGWRRDEIRGESRRNREEEKRRRHRRGGGEAVEILINGRGILTPADSDSDFEVVGLGVDSSKPFISRSDYTEFKVDQFNGLETPPALSRRASSPVLSQGSSLESLLALGVELFPSKDLLHRSASLESCLVPCRSAEEDTGGSLASLGELDLGQSREVDGGEPGKEKNNESVQGEPSSGELSRRTLDLLKRLENIQSPLASKMTRSVSDMALQSCSPQRSRLPASPSLGGRHAPLSGISGSSRKGPPSLINESSATASLTELSSTEDSSLGSEDFVVLRNQRHLFLDPTIAANANSSCYRKRCHGNSQGGQGMDEADAASLSLVVNVSCTSACTDEDEDDSDLLSSSTLTLTEEELGVRDGEDQEEERLSGASSGNEDDEDDEEEMEGSYVLGLEYMKRELQSWIRSPRTLSSSSSKTEAVLRDELQCGTNLSSIFTSSSQNKEQHCFLNRSAELIETNTNSGNNKTKRDKKEQEEEEKNQRNVTRSYISQFVDDVENGNLDQSCLKGKDEDYELLREESSVFTKKGESLRESYVFAKTGESVRDVSDFIVKTETNSTKQLSSSPSCELLPFPSKRASSLVGQLRGELPCHSSSLPSPPSLSPVEDCRSHDALHNSRPAAGGRKAITIQEKFKFSSFVTEETRREVRDKESSLPPKKRHSSHSSCCNHLPSPSSLHPCSVDEGKKENVHDFVMEIIDMTSLALKSKENQPEELNQTDNSGSIPDHGPASLAQIRDKVLEHSHRPLHLRKGDFYSYLSLSSHDSDCGEVSQCSEDKSSTPAPYSIPSYVTPTQGLHSPSPELFTSTEQQISTSDLAESSKHSSPGLHSKKNFCALDLKSTDSQTNSAASGSHTEEPLSPSLSLPPSPDIRDEETLFAACTEEVYLGPPLCYSMVLTKKPQRFLSSLDPGYELNNSVAYLPCSKPIDSLQYLSQERSSSKPGDSLSYLSPSKESVLDRNQDHLYCQGSSPTEETQSAFSPFLEPCYSSCSTSSLSNSVSASLQGPGSKPEDDNPSSPAPVSSGAEEEKRGEDPHLLCDVAGGEVAAAASVSVPQEERSRNEGPPYLNPRARVAPIDSFAAECLADTKMLESNMGAVMTKISVCSSATNPSKEPAATATRINPKINCSAMREADREEGERRGEVDTRRVKQEEKGRRGRSGSQQEAKTAAEKQVSSQSAVHHRTAPGRSQASVRPPTSRTVSRLPVLGAGTSRIQL